MPEISIIVPVYDVEKYIKQCLRSIEKQLFDDFECICVDDCSPDNSVDIIETFVKKDDRFKLIRHERNLKLGMARNTGIENATGKYILFVDSDDWIQEEMLSEVYHAFKVNDADSVWYNTYVHEINGKIHPMYDRMHPIFRNGNCRFNVGAFELMATSSFAWSKAYKLEKVLESNVRFPAELRFEEMVFFYKYFTKYKKACYVDQPLYHYRRRENSAVENLSHGTDNCKAEDTLYEFLEIYKYLKDENYFDEYKLALCQYLTKIIGNHNLPNQHEKIVKLTKEVFKKIDFPNDFKDLEYKENIEMW